MKLPAQWVRQYCRAAGGTSGYIGFFTVPRGLLMPDAAPAEKGDRDGYALQL